MNRPSPKHQHGEREAMLARIRRALRVSAPRPGSHTPHDRVQERRPDAPVAAADDGTNPDGSNVSLINSQVVDAGGAQIGEDDALRNDAAPSNAAQRDGAKDDTEDGSAASRLAASRYAASRYAASRYAASRLASSRYAESRSAASVQKTSSDAAPSLAHQFTSQLPIINNPPSAREWLPLVGESWDEQAELFARNAADLRAEFHLFDSRDALLHFLSALKAQENWQRAATHGGELTDAAAQALNLPLCRTDEGYDIAALESCDVGITECDALIAQTGSVLVTTRSAGGRALSALPPHHVVLARRAQMLPDLPAAFALLRERYGDNYPSLISFITGPSRTGDIERILVLGAHGPKRLTILCV